MRSWWVKRSLGALLDATVVTRSGRGDRLPTRGEWKSRHDGGLGAVSPASRTSGATPAHPTSSGFNGKPKVSNGTTTNSLKYLASDRAFGSHRKHHPRPPNFGDDKEVVSCRPATGERPGYDPFRQSIKVPVSLVPTVPGDRLDWYAGAVNLSSGPTVPHNHAESRPSVRSVTERAGS
jgi:hypothetical protein